MRFKLYYILVPKIISIRTESHKICIDSCAILALLQLQRVEYDLRNTTFNLEKFGAHATYLIAYKNSYYCSST